MGSEKDQHLSIFLAKSESSPKSKNLKPSTSTSTSTSLPKRLDKQTNKNSHHQNQTRSSHLKRSNNISLQKGKEKEKDIGKEVTYSSNNASENASTANLLAEYRLLDGFASIPAVDDIFTIVPSLLPLIAGIKIRQSASGPKKLVSIIERHSASLYP